MTDHYPVTPSPHLRARVRHLALLAQLAVSVFTLGVLTTACSVEIGDGVVDDEGFATGPTMLPGDNCRSCHGGPSSQYPDAPAWSIAGTVFEGPDSDVGAQGVSVLIRDISGKMLELTTNSAGNFYTNSEFDSPYWVSLQKDGVRVDMPAPPPSGGCNACHNNPAVGSAPGRLFLPENDTYESIAACNEDGATLFAGNTSYPCTPFACSDADDEEAAHCLETCASDDDCSVGICQDAVCVE